MRIIWMLGVLLSQFVGAARAEPTWTMRVGVADKWVGPDFGYLVRDKPVFWTTHVFGFQNGMFLGAYYRKGADEVDFFGGWGGMVAGIDVRLELNYYSFSALSRALDDAVTVAGETSKSFSFGRLGTLSPYLRLEPWYLLSGHTSIATHVGLRHSVALNGFLDLRSSTRFVYDTGTFGEAGLNWAFEIGPVLKLDRGIEVSPRWRHIQPVSGISDGRKSQDVFLIEAKIPVLR